MAPYVLTRGEAKKVFDLEAGRHAIRWSSSGSSTYSETGSDHSTLCEDSRYMEDIDQKTVTQIKVAPRTHLSSAEIDAGPDDFELPEKSGSRIYRWIRWICFSIYRRLFSLVFATNLFVLLVLATRTFTAQNGLTFYSTLTATSVNLALSILVRHEHFVNLLFRLSTAVSPKAPLFARRWIAKVYGYGGLHSGCALGAVVWYIAFNCLVIYYMVRPPGVHAAITVVTFANLLLLLTVTTFSHPWLRTRMHNWFEATHRFVGWSSIALFWAQIIVMAWVETNTRPNPKAALGQELVQTPAFWCIILITLCVIYPWLHLRQHAVIAEPLSPHAIRLHFTHRNVDMCQAIRIGDQPLRETHAFATIARKHSTSLPDEAETCSHCERSKNIQKGQQIQEKGFSIVISRAGDWTSRIIANPPSHMYIRGTPTYGVLRIATLFSPVLIVATGSGIGPCLSLFRGRPDLNCRVLWSTPSPLETYGPEIVSDVFAADSKAVIIDTRTEGRPDLTRRAYDMWKRQGCEAVVLISNATVTKKVIYGLETRGVPAFAPIFDS